MDISPVTTIAYGRRFRSRLEARWAVFFTTLGIPWEYEPEAFRTTKGVYLPDFIVCGRYAEVKPVLDELAFNKAISFAKEHNKQLVCLGGMPDYITYPSWHGSEVDRVGFLGGEKRFFTGIYERFWDGCCCYDKLEELFLWRVPGYIKAINAARSADFNHGRVILPDPISSEFCPGSIALQLDGGI